MKKILVPTDFSANADKALNFAVQLAKKAEGEIFLIHVVDTDKTEVAIKEADEKMEFIKINISENELVPISVIIYSGSPVHSILEAVREFNADLVVMGTVGNAALKEKIFGSRTADVIGKSPVPVLAIPLLGEWKIPQKILLAINKFEGNESQLQPALQLAKLFMASVQVAIFTDTDDDFVEDYEEHEVKIAAFKDSLKNEHKDIEFHAVHLAGHHFRENLQHWVEENNIDILVMLTHKRTLIKSMFNWSMTKKMSYHTDIPLLSIPV